MRANRKAVLEYGGLSMGQRDAIGGNILSLLPAAAKRLKEY